jgi:hypothetical protein
MPVVQPVVTLTLVAITTFPVAFAGVAALHFQPYVAPLLLLPLLWLGLVLASLLGLVVFKWLLLLRVQPQAYAKYSWAFQTKVLYVAVSVSFDPPPPNCSLSLCSFHAMAPHSYMLPQDQRCDM